jgi:hypothetical protein
VLRSALGSFVLAVTLVVPIEAQTYPTDPSGTWTVSSTSKDGKTIHVGEATIARNDEC